jgi:uncharacterized peroxidase-related enzyme
MPRVLPIDPAKADSDTQATLDGVKKKIGMVPNLYATFAHSPAVLKAFLGLSETLAGGRLTPAQREIVALSVGQANSCQYCLSAHTMVGKSVGLSEEQIVDARQGTNEAPLEHAVAEVANRIVTQKGWLTDEDVAAARSAGIDDELLLEVIANVSLNLLTNYTNHIVQTDIDFPAVSTSLDN